MKEAKSKVLTFIGNHVTECLVGTTVVVGVTSVALWAFAMIKYDC